MVPPYHHVGLIDWIHVLMMSRFHADVIFDCLLALLLRVDITSEGEHLVISYFIASIYSLCAELEGVID